MKVIETPKDMIEFLRVCEAAAVTEPTRGYYRRLQEWLEDYIKLLAKDKRNEEETSKLHEQISNLKLVLSKCGVGYKA